MSAPRLPNEWITTPNGTYNCWTIIRQSADLVDAGLFGYNEAGHVRYWMNAYMENGPMPGFTRFLGPRGDFVTFLECIQDINDVWFERQNDEETIDDVDDDEMSTFVLNDEEVAEIFATAHWVRDLLNDETGSWTQEDIDELPEATVLEVVNDYWD